MDKIFSSEEDEDVVEIKQTSQPQLNHDITNESKEKKEIINRDVFWTGINVQSNNDPTTLINPEKDKVDDFLGAFTRVNQNDDSKKPYLPTSIQKLNELSKTYGKKRNEFKVNEELYDECYPKFGKEEMARVDEHSGKVIHNSMDSTQFSIDKKKKKKTKDKWESIQQSLKDKYGEHIEDD